MNTHSTPITVVTSPTGETSPPTKTSPSTPRAAGPPIPYRIEEHRRTIFLTSSLPPGKWDTKALGELLSLPEIPDEGAQLDGQMQRHRRAKSLNENDLTVLMDHADQKSKEPPSSPPRTFRHGNNPGIQTGGGSSSTPTTPTVTLRGSPRTPTRHRILFYHRHDPHYGFTNFSAHAVVFNGKRYPTSEHLFQSFKVCLVPCIHSLLIINDISSSKNIALILQSIFEHVLRGRVSPFHKHVDSNPKSELTG
jgi:hypothetical protein